MTSVVINAAGAGTRLGQSIPKSLVEVAGRTMIDWQLRVLCADVDQVALVVGFKGEELAALAREIRPELVIVVNERWNETKTGGSLSRGVQAFPGRVVSLDGDLLVAPKDFRRFLAADHDMIGVCEVGSAEPVYADVDAGLKCHGFSYETLTPWEWSGLLSFDPSHAVLGDGNVYEIVESILPVSASVIRCVEVDTPEDLKRAETLWPEMVVEQ